ncbi:hypothetical protein BGZ95_002891 [Linnemannia exigua]|uniref:AT hook domain-containing protein n=1 Tax=Linnemannia exigua TaxID=604196 RepID=A0AAD4H418_9FUNG|nr:hypothetical protein BGZ95_002891 [Linnemannia exigua]
MSYTQGSHQSASGPAATPHASYPHKTTTASAIPTTATNHSAINATSTTASTDSSVSDNAATTAAVVPVKRGRGRPRKFPLETNDDNNSNNAISPSDTTPVAGQRKRGRPRLDKPSVEKPSSGPKRGRGRPRKIPIDENTGVSGSKKASALSSTSDQRQSSTASTSVGHHASVSEPPRKRGRPRKV